MVFQPDLRGHGDSEGRDTVKGGSYQHRAWHVYVGDNHDRSIDPGVAIQRTVAFFVRYVKDENE